jgi:hypothetical protein
MAQIEFDSSDLEGLATKLDSASGSLDERERAMLLAVFKMAGDQVVDRAAAIQGFARANAPTFRVSVPEEVPALSEGFVNSFSPEVATDALAGGETAVEWDVSVGVMGGMGGMFDEREIAIPDRIIERGENG